jgi:hypothetical protein
MRKLPIYFFISCFLLFFSCDKESSIYDPLKESFAFNGTITFQSFEGGFYGILSDDGQKYDPINLPDDYKMKDLKVEVFATIDHSQSIHMWGTLIKIYSIKKK